MALRALLVSSVVFVVVGSACKESAGPRADAGDGSLAACPTRPLPLQGNPNAPVLTMVGLECSQEHVNLVASATDPQGDGDLRDVQQTFDVFDTAACTNARWSVTDDFVDSKTVEDFSIVLQRTDAPTAFDDICRSSHWPVRARLIDATGNQTEGLVAAAVAHVPGLTR